MTVPDRQASEHLCAQPPRPRICLRVGVVGHRPHILPSDTSRLQAVIENTLAQIQETLVSVFDQNTDILSAYDDTKTVCIRIISSLAEGGDRIVVKAGQPLKCDLQCILPFSKDEFENDFETESSLTEFRDLLDTASAVYVLPGSRESAETNNASYRDAGLLTLRQSDVLLALWDGESGRGLGGTADMVAESANAGIPVIWINTKTAARCIIEGREGRRETPEDLSKRAPIVEDAELEQLVKGLTEPPQADEPDFGLQTGRRGTARKRLKQFLQETEQRSLKWHAWVHRFFVNVGNMSWSPLRLELPPYAEKTARDWQPFYKALSDMSIKPPVGIHERVEPRFSWADNLALYFSELYRSSFISIYLLTALAVALSVLTSFTALKDFALVTVGLEFFLISIMFVVWAAGAWGRWHERFLDYRQLAELLRHLQLTTLAGSRSSAMGLQPLNLDVRPGPRWVNWYFRSTLREISLLNRMPADKLAETAARIAVETAIQDQIEYHSQSSKRYMRIHRMLEIGGGLAFALTFLLVGAYTFGLLWVCGLSLSCVGTLVGQAGSPLAVSGGLSQTLANNTSWVIFLGAVLPAFGAALRSIRIHGEFRESAERSSLMANRLSGIKTDLEVSIEQGDWRSASEGIEEALQLMSDEVSVWRFVYRSKHVNLPE